MGMSLFHCRRRRGRDAELGIDLDLGIVLALCVILIHKRGTTTRTTTSFCFLLVFLRSSIASIFWLEQWSLLSFASIGSRSREEILCQFIGMRLIPHIVISTIIVSVFIAAWIIADVASIHIEGDLQSKASLLPNGRFLPPLSFLRLRWILILVLILGIWIMLTFALLLDIFILVQVRIARRGAIRGGRQMQFRFEGGNWLFGCGSCGSCGCGLRSYAFLLLSRGDRRNHSDRWCSRERGDDTGLHRLHWWRRDREVSFLLLWRVKTNNEKWNWKQRRLLFWCSMSCLSLFCATLAGDE